MPRFLLKLLCLLLIGYMVYKKRYRIFNQVLALQAIRHLITAKPYSLTALRERFLDRFLFSE